MNNLLDTNPLLFDPPPFELLKPKRLRAGILFASPHSGRFIPKQMLANTRLGELSLQNYGDAYVDKIIENIPDKGLPAITGTYSRAFVDLNRDPSIFDDKVVDCVTPQNYCEYTASGFGLFARNICHGSPINISKISLEDAKARIAAVHAPYHGQITQQLTKLHERFGEAWLFDVHSMPNSGLGGNYADIILGNRFGSSCNVEITKMVKQHFENAGLKIRINHPFAGAYTTKTYGNPVSGRHALQIEINRSLYMNEHSLELNSGFFLMHEVFNNLAATAKDFFNQRNAALIT